MHGLPITVPYVTKDYLQQKRFQAQSTGTAYVKEKENKLIETKRLPGENDVGMVAWKVSFNTPEYPTGQSGSNLENQKKVNEYGTEPQLRTPNACQRNQE
ncbi:hypothetical protein Phum_PHUM248870 [Pediculus humanus corporis]|uniref:Uncharacterized protein n=1 Tax=Pediculus humanus subsp. corporis TaxID=121224 RepID=E0VJP8_PEDHC|nr:uncharacterized protein Phum_PHUM248870 [Pediculus humanus corporis]EEB13604.1 hypothetical protein Phum_PHUM248870 [Pediculus humanus corporis]